MRLEKELRSAQIGSRATLGTSVSVFRAEAQESKHSGSFCLSAAILDNLHRQFHFILTKYGEICIILSSQYY